MEVFGFVSVFLIGKYSIIFMLEGKRNSGAIFMTMMLFQFLSCNLAAFRFIFYKALHKCGNFFSFSFFYFLFFSVSHKNSTVNDIYSSITITFR